jgi:hypothetical protein
VAEGSREAGQNDQGCDNRTDQDQFKTLKDNQDIVRQCEVTNSSKILLGLVIPYGLYPKRNEVPLK